MLLRTIALGLLWAASLGAQAPVPRPAPELKIGSAMLSQFRGRVVLLAFISTQCPHCQRVSQVFEQLSHEYSGKLQVAEVAFDEGADPAAFSKRFGLSFPVSVGSSDAAHDFLGVAHGLRVGTPQIVAIDRKGTIRAQSERAGSPLLQSPDFLHGLLDALFREGRW